MPIIGPVPAAALGKARLAAKQGVRAKWVAFAARVNRKFTAAERHQMDLEYETAVAAVDLAFLVANMVVTTPPGGGVGIIT